MQWLFMKIYFDPDSSFIIIAPTIFGRNGLKKKIDMVLDTGATYTMIPWEIAEVLGYEPASCKQKIELVTASGVEKVPCITLQSISISEKNVNDVKAIVHDLPAKSYVDGLLGLSFLKQCILSIDFKNGLLEI